MKHRSLSQKWAHERNWNKCKIKGIQQTLISIRGDKSTNDADASLITGAQAYIDALLDYWESRNEASKKRYIELCEQHKLNYGKYPIR